MNTKFYNNFHKKSSPIKRILGINDFTYRLILPVINKVIRGRKNLHILDYGCGVGTIDLYLATQGHSVTGIDISPIAIKIANENKINFGLYKNCTFLTLEDRKKMKVLKQFDLILCLEVIEHIRNDEKLICLLVNECKPEGTLIISTPSKNAPLFKLGVLKEFDKEVGHFRRYRPEQLIDLIERAGLKISELIKNEGIIRNSLFTLKGLGFLVRLVRGPISTFVTWIDNITVPVLGESDLIVIASKE